MAAVAAVAAVAAASAVPVPTHLFKWSPANTNAVLKIHADFTEVERPGSVGCFPMVTATPAVPKLGSGQQLVCCMQVLTDRRTD